ncbi:MAG: hypothetical protein WCA35_17350, partial [Kovacikia sp.]
MKFLRLLNSFWVKRWRQSRLFRHLSWLIIFIFSAILAISPVLSQQPVTLKLLMTAPDVPPWSKVMVKDFEKKYPRIKLQIVEGPNATNLI